MANKSQGNKQNRKNTHVGLMVVLGFVASFVFLFAMFMVSGRTVSEIVHEAEFWLFWLIICALIVYCVFVMWLERKLNPPTETDPTPPEENPEPKGDGENM